MKLNDLVNDMFPPVPKALNANKKFGNFEYWHVPPPTVSVSPYTSPHSPKLISISPTLVCAQLTAEDLALVS
jgi:hypothetical protein